MAQKTLIVGLGATGLSCLRHLAGSDDLVVMDTREQPPCLGEATAEHPEVEYRLGACEVEFRRLDRVIMSPGLSLKSALAKRILASGLPVLSDIDLFCRAVDEPIFAVTGTNGKSTVTTLAGHALAKLNHRPGVGGNLGEAALDVIRPDCDCYVLELSSFQLERMQTYPYQAAAILNISADHLDRHNGMDGYRRAKQRIYRAAERAVANRDDPPTLPEAPRALERLVTFGADAPDAGHWGIRLMDGARWLSWGDAGVIAAERLPLGGAHNEANVMAALALLHGGGELGVCPSLEALGEAVLGYKGLAHRCEVVAVVGGVTYVNDSKATNPGATLAALASLSARPGGLTLIAGGVGKGADFGPLGDAIAKRVRLLIAFGQDGPAIAAAAGAGAQVAHSRCLADAVRLAAKGAEPGDTVLLSPACASFDHFRDFQDRGNAFRALVAELTP